MPDCTQSGATLKDCNFLLLPYSNRIRDAKFQFDGQSYQLENAAKHAIHGFLRDQPWVVDEATESRLVACFKSHDKTSANWPWPITVRCEITANGSILNCLLEVINDGDSNMPIGGGWHPYFVRTLKKAQPELTIPVTGVYPDTDGDCLPTGGPEPIPEALAFANRSPLAPDQRIDHCFAGLSKPLEIHWPDVNTTLEMRGSDNVTHAILFNPDKPYFALEPVTHANDGVNLIATGIASGIASLAPGDTWQTRLAMELR